MFGNSPIRAHSWWHGFYADRSKPVPSFVPKPDEKLGSYLDRGLITPVRALDLGCGPGRNALHLGFEVDAVARERAHETTADVRFVCGDAFALPGTGLGCPYDLIYDSGCFHHLPPHRRVSTWHFWNGTSHPVAAGLVARADSTAVSPTRPRPCAGSSDSSCFGEPFLRAGLFGRDH